MAATRRSRQTTVNLSAILPPI